MSNKNRDRKNKYTFFQFVLFYDFSINGTNVSCLYFVERVNMIVDVHD